MAFELLTPAVQAEITAILTNVALSVVIAAIGFVGRAVHGWVNANKNDKNLGFVISVATMAVQAAEQVYGSEAGQDKKQFALDYVKAELTRRNIQVDVDAISAAIESAVMAEFNFPASIEPADPPTETVVVAGNTETGAGE